MLLDPQIDKHFVLSTDASGTGLGAVLSQENKEGQERPVAYYYRGLSKVERNYSATELECLAVVAAVKNSRIIWNFYHLLLLSWSTLLGQNDRHEGKINLLGTYSSTL